MNKHDYSSDWDYHDSLLGPSQRYAEHILDNDVLTDHDWLCMIEEHWDEALETLVESGKVYDWLVEDFKDKLEG